MKLHILSDLHLGFDALEPPRVAADVTILAGDIARPHQAIAWASSLARPVLYVPGNHEFYGGEMAGTVAELKRLSQGTLIQVLDCDEVVLDGVRFLGATLWTDFLLWEDEEQRAWAIAQAHLFIRDFSRIWLDEARETRFSPADAAALCARHQAWLQAQLAEPFAGPTVVVTHHAPSPQSIHPRFAGSPLNLCFVSNLESLLGSERVVLWIHGHTHDRFDYHVNGTRVVCNPRGYARQGINENPAFDPHFTIDLGRDLVSD